MITHYPSAIPNLELSAAWHLYEVILRQDTLARLDVRRPSNRAWNATCCFCVLEIHRGSCFASVWTTKLKHGGRRFFRSKCELVWTGLVSRYDSNFSPWSHDFLCGTSTDDLKLWNFARTFGPSLSPWSTQRWNWKSPSFWHRRLRWWLWPSCSAPWRRGSKTQKTSMFIRLGSSMLQVWTSIDQPFAMDSPGWNQFRMVGL